MSTRPDAGPRDSSWTSSTTRTPAPITPTQCYGLSPVQMVSWIGAFGAEAQRLTGQRPVIYTTRLLVGRLHGRQHRLQRRPALGCRPGAPAGRGEPASLAGWAYWALLAVHQRRDRARHRRPGTPTSASRPEPDGRGHRRGGWGGRGFWGAGGAVAGSGGSGARAGRGFGGPGASGGGRRPRPASRRPVASAPESRSSRRQATADRAARCPRPVSCGRATSALGRGLGGSGGP